MSYNSASLARTSAFPQMHAIPKRFLASKMAKLHQLSWILFQNQILLLLIIYEFSHFENYFGCPKYSFSFIRTKPLSSLPMKFVSYENFVSHFIFSKFALRSIKAIKRNFFEQQHITIWISIFRVSFIIHHFALVTLWNWFSNKKMKILWKWEMK